MAPKAATKAAVSVKQGKKRKNEGGLETAATKKAKLDTAQKGTLHIGTKENGGEKTLKSILKKPKSSELLVSDGKSPLLIAKKASMTEKKSQKVKVSPLSTETSTSISVFVGTYERILYGLSFTMSPICSIEPIFSFPAHLSCIKALGVAKKGRYLLSAGTDDLTKLWDLRRKKEVGMLAGLEGTVTDIVQVKDLASILIATVNPSVYAKDEQKGGTLYLYRERDWLLLRRFKGHNLRTNSISVHPAGRVCLSVGVSEGKSGMKKYELKMWDLLAGKEEGKTALASEPDLIRFNSSGTHFALVSLSNLTVYGLDLRPITELNAKPNSSRFHDVQFAKYDEEERMFVACEDGKVRVYNDSNLTGDEEQDNQLTDVAVLKGHTNRVKQIAVRSLRMGDEDKVVVVTISTDGYVNFHDVSSLWSKSGHAAEFSPISRYNTKGMRLVCLEVQTMSNMDESESSEESEEAQSEGDGGEIAFMSEEESMESE